MNLILNEKQNLWKPVNAIEGLLPLTWLDARRITGLADGGAVSTWADISGNGRDFTQATTSLKPTFKTNILAGNPVVRFDGVDDILSLGGSLNLKAGATVIAVFKVVDGTVSQAILSKQTNDLAFLQWTIAPIGLGMAKSGVAAISSEGTLGVSTWQIAIWTWDGATTGTSIVYRNGTQVATGTFTTANLTNGTTLIMGRDIVDNGTGQLNGDMAEVLIYPGALSIAGVKTVSGYAGRKHGIGII